LLADPAFSLASFVRLCRLPCFPCRSVHPPFVALLVFLECFAFLFLEAGSSCLLADPAFSLALANIFNWFTFHQLGFGRWPQEIYYFSHHLQVKH
jgi:hypothetical protein